MKWPLTILILLGAIGCHAQSGASGSVVDKFTHAPLELAVVQDMATGESVFTDGQGHFSLTRSSGDTLRVSVSFIGYQSRQLGLSAHNRHALIELEMSPLDLKTVTITGKAGINSFHTLGRIDLNLQPARSAQDLLRLVPGLFIAQHQGGGKAEQIFLRGFDADHGTDVNISVDGIPVNLVSHAHGQGYADLHFLIPETVASYDFGKGPYYAGRGDFTTAGYIAYQTINVPEHSMVKAEGGQFNTGRIVALLDLLPKKARDQGRSAYIAGEGLYSDGPFDYPEQFNRVNLFGKFITPLNSSNQLTLTLSTFASGWRASGEIPNRAVAEGVIHDRFGVIDSAQGGYTSRTNASIRLLSNLSHHFTLENQVYYSHYFFNLISNFTFYYFYPSAGDEFRQHEERNITGTNTRLSHQATIAAGTLTSVIGIGTRYDAINPSMLAHTLDGKQLLGYIQSGHIRETNGNAYLDESFESGKWLFNAGLRLDHLQFFYGNEAPTADTAAAIYHDRSPRSAKTIFCPKISVQYTPNAQLQFYARTGKGFHSNDARIVIANRGYQILPAAYGADLGINWKPLPGLFVNAALWYLYLQQEFTYGADLGDQAVSPGGKTTRKGLDLALRYQLTPWLYGALNIDLAKPRQQDAPKGQDYLPLAPTFTSTGGLDFHLPNGLNGGISYRYMHNRPANETNTLTALGYWVSDLTVNYTRKRYELGLAVENLLNTTWNESQFAYTSRLRSEAAPVNEVSYTPGTPFFLKLKYARFF
ncbi:TonB-dependent receptor [Puia dinghuensis]|uniref:TonB-dependent receptor n=1 Tax=Puia dinghuensis TaxID=1792502 RepID=A0A8J2U7I4_9BACT|nr:TonB-dependent receptor [Puia dinghuensis]GGA84354.1 TonB-dependent receptor [Puia dinghuensis]